jgi:O-antigen ligase
MLKKIIPFIRRTNSLEVAWLLIYAATLTYSRDTLATELNPTLGMANLLRMFFVSSSLTIVFVHLLKGIPYPRFNAVWIFFIYLCIGLISTVWSVSQIKTFGKVLEILAPTLIVLLCANKANAGDRLRRLFDWYILMYFIIVMVHIIGLFIAPDIFFHSIEGHGISSQLFPSNSISILSAILAIVFISRWGEAILLRVQIIRGVSRREYLFWFLIFFIACVFGHGRTAIGIAVLSTILIVLRTKLTFPILLLAVSIPLLIISFSDPIIEYLYRGQDLEAIKGLSGRRQLIEMGLPYFFESPTIGYGFGVGSDYVFNRIGASGLTNYGKTISSLHNGIIEILLGTGILGLAIISLSMIKAFLAYARSYLRGRDLDKAIMPIYIISYTFVSGIGIGGWMSDIVGLYLVSSAIVSLDVQVDENPSYS